MLLSPETDTQRLQLLCERYQRRSQLLARLRQVRIEQLGDAMCDRSLPPPDASEIALIEQLGRAEARARERYEWCSLAMARTVSERARQAARRVDAGCDAAPGRASIPDGRANPRLSALRPSANEPGSFRRHA